MIVFINIDQEISMYLDLGQCLDNELDFRYSTIINTDNGEVFKYDSDGVLESQDVVAVFVDEYEDEDE